MMADRGSNDIATSAALKGQAGPASRAASLAAPVRGSKITGGTRGEPPSTKSKDLPLVGRSL